MRRGAVDVVGWLLACAMAVGVRVWFRGLRSALNLPKTDRSRL